MFTVYVRVTNPLCVQQHSDMNAGAKLAALNKFRGSNAPIGRPPITRVLVVSDVPVKTPEVQQVPLVINYGDIVSFCWPYTAVKCLL